MRTSKGRFYAGSNKADSHQAANAGSFSFRLFLPCQSKKWNGLAAVSAETARPKTLPMPRSYSQSPLSASPRESALFEDATRTRTSLAVAQLHLIFRGIECKDCARRESLPNVVALADMNGGNDDCGAPEIMAAEFLSETGLVRAEHGINLDWRAIIGLLLLVEERQQ